jgi:hypothetical protein
VTGCDRQQFFERADAGHAVADHDESGFAHDVRCAEVSRSG